MLVCLFVCSGCAAASSLFCLISDYVEGRAYGQALAWLARGFSKAPWAFFVIHHYEHAVYDMPREERGYHISSGTLSPTTSEEYFSATLARLSNPSK